MSKQCGLLGHNRLTLQKSPSDVLETPAHIIRGSVLALRPDVFLNLRRQLARRALFCPGAIFQHHQHTQSSTPARTGSAEKARCWHSCVDPIGQLFPHIAIFSLSRTTISGTEDVETFLSSGRAAGVEKARCWHSCWLLADNSAVPTYCHLRTCLDHPFSPALSGTEPSWASPGQS